MEHLFVEAVADTMADPVIQKRDNLSAPDRRPAPDRAQAMAEALEAITHPAAPPLDGFRVMLKNAVDAAPVSRAQIAKRHFKTLESTLGGPNTVERRRIEIAHTAVPGGANDLHPLLAGHRNAAAPKRRRPKPQRSHVQRCLPDASLVPIGHAILPFRAGSGQAIARQVNSLAREKAAV